MMLFCFFLFLYRIEGKSKNLTIHHRLIISAIYRCLYWFVTLIIKEILEHVILD